MGATLAAAVRMGSTALLQLPGPLNSPLGTVFLALVAALVVLLIGRVVLKIAWKLALLGAIGVGLFLLVTTFLV